MLRNLILTLFALTHRVTVAFYNVQHIKRNFVTNAVAQQTTPILPIDDIAGRWKVTKFGQDGYNGIEVADKNYCYLPYQITMKRTGGLGLDLLEYNTGKGNLGLVLVGDVIPGSNAAASGKFVVGDALTEISAGEKGQEKVERLEGNLTCICPVLSIPNLVSALLTCPVNTALLTCPNNSQSQRSSNTLSIPNLSYLPF